MGLIIAVVVHSADIQDRDGGLLILRQIKNSLTALILIWADGGYRGEFLQKAHKIFRRKVKIVEKDRQQKGFKVLPRRWVVERTFAWISNFRRHSKDYELLTSSSESMIYISMIQIMLKRF